METNLEGKPDETLKEGLDAPVWDYELTVNEWTHLALVVDTKSHFAAYYEGRPVGVWQMSGTPVFAWFYYNFMFSECVGRTLVA